jgi:N-methylhydantoinase A
MLVTDLRHDFVQTFVKPVADADVDVLDQTYRSLERNGAEILAKEKVKESDIQLLRAIDIRYLGQEHTLTIPLMSNNVTEQDKQSVCNRFDEFHEKTYRHSAPQEPKEIVSLRVIAIGVVSKPKLRKLGSGLRRPSEHAFKGMRRVYFERENDFVNCPTYERDRLLSGNIIEGPAVIEEPTSTTLLHPGQVLTVDIYGNLLINVGS